MKTPIVFLSYSHDTDAHKEWVIKLATDLRAKGVDARLDQWDLLPGQDIVTFMEKGISDSDRVLMICSESYVKKANEGSGGVGYERLIVTAEVTQNIDTMKFIPLVRNNPSNLKLPRFLGNRLYVDFSNEEQYGKKLHELLRAIHQVIDKPPLGTNPFSVVAPAPATRGSLAGPKAVSNRLKEEKASLPTTKHEATPATTTSVSADEKGDYDRSIADYNAGIKKQVRPPSSPEPGTAGFYSLAFCAACGEKLESDFEFCPECGTQVKDML
ncbi:MAG: TIR domain-containing protein [Nitrospirae bacterium]|nr:TIR domain-containing protein [Nitrospirota bacterium]